MATLRTRSRRSNALRDGLLGAAAAGVALLAAATFATVIRFWGPAVAAGTAAGGRAVAAGARYQR